MALIEKSRSPTRRDQLTDVGYGVSFALAVGLMVAVVLGLVH